MHCTTFNYSRQLYTGTTLYVVSGYEYKAKTRFSGTNPANLIRKTKIKGQSSFCPRRHWMGIEGKCEANTIEGKSGHLLSIEDLIITILYCLPDMNILQIL